MPAIPYATSLSTMGSPGNAAGTEADFQNVLFPRAINTSAVFEVTDKPIMLRAFGFGPTTTACLYMVYGSGASQRTELFGLGGINYCLTQTNNAMTVAVEGRYYLVLTNAVSTAVTVTMTGVGLDYGNLDMLDNARSAGGVLIAGLPPATLPVDAADLVALSQNGSTQRRVTVAALTARADAAIALAAAAVPWTAFTPVIIPQTGAFGAGTVLTSARYTVVQKTVHWRLDFRIPNSGALGTGTGQLFIAPPVTIATTSAGNGFEISATNASLQVRHNAISVISVGTAASNDGVVANNTWFFLSGTYEST